jgi:hypothetical protein
VLARQMVLNDADASTVRYYKDVLGIDVMAKGGLPRGVSASSTRGSTSGGGGGGGGAASPHSGGRGEERSVAAVREMEKQQRQRAILVPPHNGFGKEEDTRQNCLSLHPKPPRVNVVRLLENKGKMLRFLAKLEHAVGFDVERVFTLTYFLDTGMPAAN